MTEPRRISALGYSTTPSPDDRAGPIYQALGSGTTMTVRSSIPEKSDGIAGVNGEVIGDGSRCDHRVVGAR